MSDESRMSSEHMSEDFIKEVDATLAKETLRKPFNIIPVKEKRTVFQKYSVPLAK